MADENDIPLVDDGAEAPDVGPLAVDWWRVEGVTAPCICNIDSETREFLSAGKADYSPLEPGVWLIPGLAYQCEPPEAQEGYAAVRSADGTEWVPVVDHRGKTIYSTVDGSADVCTTLGELTSSWTLTAPTSEHDQWQDGEWVPDETAIEADRVAKAARKKALLTQLSANSITTLQYAADLDMATEAETASLKAWKVYQVLLSRLPAAPTDDQWPSSPIGAEALSVWLAAQGFDDTAAAA
jgi:hypothetical protein